MSVRSSRISNGTQTAGLHPRARVIRGDARRWHSGTRCGPVVISSATERGRLIFMDGDMCSEWYGPPRNECSHRHRKGWWRPYPTITALFLLLLASSRIAAEHSERASSPDELLWRDYRQPSGGTNLIVHWSIYLQHPSKPVTPRQSLPSEGSPMH